MTFMGSGCTYRSPRRLCNDDPVSKRVPPPATPKQVKPPKVSEVVQSGVRLSHGYRTVYTGEELATILLRGRTWLPEGDYVTQILSLPASFKAKYYVQDVASFGGGYIVEAELR